MELYLESYDLKEIEEAFKSGIPSGLTTSPGFIQRSTISDETALIQKISSLASVIHIDAIGEKSETIVHEARRLMSIGIKPDCRKESPLRSYIGSRLIDIWPFPDTGTQLMCCFRKQFGLAAASHQMPASRPLSHSRQTKRTPELTGLSLLNTIQMRIRAQEDSVIDHRGSRQGSAFQLVAGERLEFLAGGDDGGNSVFIQQIDTAIGKCR